MDCPALSTLDTMPLPKLMSLHDSGMLVSPSHIHVFIVVSLLWSLKAGTRSISLISTNFHQVMTVKSM